MARLTGIELFENETLGKLHKFRQIVIHRYILSKLLSFSGEVLRHTGAPPHLDGRIFFLTPFLATLVFSHMASLLALRQLLGPGSSEITSSQFHTSSVVLAQLRRKSKKPNGKPSSSPRTGLAESLQPTGKAKRLGKLEIAPARPEFKRDAVPHEGLAPRQRESPPVRRTTSESRSIPRRRAPNDDADETRVKNWAIKAHSELERIDRGARL
ncbi:hypothetical protein BDR04DRAFT_1141774 [Suillus decipiens]|nr:hypothetical protein BDR04DRAFT_1141774 [Suillus decipiens]